MCVLVLYTNQQCIIHICSVIALIPHTLVVSVDIYQLFSCIPSYLTLQLIIQLYQSIFRALVRPFSYFSYNLRVEIAVSQVFTPASEKPVLTLYKVKFPRLICYLILITFPLFSLIYSVIELFQLIFTQYRVCHYQFSELHQCYWFLNVSIISIIISIFRLFRLFRLSISSP